MNSSRSFADLQKSIAVALIIFIFSLFISGEPATASATPPETPHTIFVTFYGDPHSQRGFTWLTDLPQANSKLEISRTSDFSKSLSVAASTYTIYGGDRTNIKIGNYGITQYGHKAVATGLAAGTKYYYRVGVDEAWSNMGSFTTEKKSHREFSFIDVTDTQAVAHNNNDYYNDWAFCLFEAFHKDPNASFVMDNGDMVNNGGDLSQWQAFSDSAKVELLNTTFVPVSGNHETYQADKIYGSIVIKNKYGISRIGGSYKDAVINHFNLSLPSTEKNVHQGAYYSFDYGNARFMVINTNDLNKDGTLSDGQVKWLNAECKNCKQKWKIVSMHRAVESDGVNMGTAEVMALRSQLLKLIAKDGVDIVLQGHDHIYLRSKPININGRPVEKVKKATKYIGGLRTTFDVNPKGTVYIIPGASNDEFCKNKYNPNSNNRNIAAASRNIFIAKNIPSQKNATLDVKSYSWLGAPAFAVIKISGNRLIFKCYQYAIGSGHLKTLDSYAILKAD